MSYLGDSGSRYLPWVKVALGILLTVIGSELYLRLLADDIDAQAGWPDRRTAGVVEALRRADPATEVVFVGSSQAVYAVDPGQFSAITGWPSFNAGLSAARPELVDVWLSEVVLQLIEPSTVVIIVSPQDLNDASSPRFTPETLVSSSGFSLLRSDTIVSSVEQWLYDNVALIRYRQSFQDPDEGIRVISRFLRHEAAGPLSGVDDQGGVVTFPQLKSISATLTARGVETYASRYRVSGERSQRLESTIRQLQDDGLDVVVVSVATHRDSFAYLANGCSDMFLYWRELDRIVDVTGVTFLNGESVATLDTDYFDPIHMTAAGRSVFTEWLASALLPPAGSDSVPTQNQRCPGSSPK